MKLRILLVNPPIYEFSAYDFWLKTYGMLHVAGFLRGQMGFAGSLGIATCCRNSRRFRARLTVKFAAAGST
jgi:hypothetical protein